MLALEAIAAVPAQRQRGVAAPVEEQQRLLAALHPRKQLARKAGREPAAPLGRLLGQVEQADRGQRRAAEAAGQVELPVGADLGHVQAFECGGSTGKYHRYPLEVAAHHRDIARVITHAVVLLEAYLVRFVDDDQAELGVGQE